METQMSQDVQDNSEQQKRVGSITILHYKLYHKTIVIKAHGITIKIDILII